MPEAWLLLGALLLNIAGLGWLGLSLDVHWRQARGGAPLPRGAVPVLRVLGAASLLLSLLCCLGADHPSMAALVWIMALAVAALVVAFSFTWRPRLWRPLVGWIGA